MALDSLDPKLIRTRLVTGRGAATAAGPRGGLSPVVLRFFAVPAADACTGGGLRLALLRFLVVPAAAAGTGGRLTVSPAVLRFLIVPAAAPGTRGGLFPAVLDLENK
jgi:hypothetical protein